MSAFLKNFVFYREGVKNFGFYIMGDHTVPYLGNLEESKSLIFKGIA